MQADSIFRELVKDIRLEKGLTQSQLAKRLHVPQSYVSKYETGERRLDFAETVVVCNELGLSLKTFVDLYVKRHSSMKPSGATPQGSQP